LPAFPGNLRAINALRECFGGALFLPWLTTPLPMSGDALFEDFRVRAMKKTHVSLLRSRRPAAHQELAAAVIRQAVLDASNADAPEPVRLGARAFLAGSPALLHWCDVAGLDPALVCAKLNRAQIRRVDRLAGSRGVQRVA
jgi:hypothetical protein